MKILRLLVMVAVIAGAGTVAYRWEFARPIAVVPPVVYAVESPSERFPASALDVLEHGRGPAVPSAWVSGFAVPEGYEMPAEPELLPNSEREYRGGFHEGVDFPLAFGMAAVAAKAGKIVRVDTEYVEWSVEEQIQGEDLGFRLGYTPENILDKLRGRQVWIDHGHGVVSRYAHLQSVEPLSVGQYVEQGQVIGHVGNSGTKAGPHLHIEIRVGDAYLGDGLTGEQLLFVLRRAFSQ